MPTRVKTLHRRAKHAKIGESLKAVLDFVNVGRATYGEYVFRASEPEQAAIRDALTPILIRLHNASANGEDLPALTGEAQLDALLPTLPSVPSVDIGALDTGALRRRVEDLDRGITELERLRPAAVLIGLWNGILESYLLHPRYQGYRLLERCRFCGGYFHQKDVREQCCSTKCKRRANSPHST